MTQDEAFAILKTGLNVFLTGEPGSGKTHTINRYIAWLRERGVEAAVTASTGIAATHVGGQTIHSWSGIGVKRHVSDYDIELIHSREKTARRIVDAKVLIIDEISMLDAATLESVDRVLRTLRHRPPVEEQPFGGLQVIFVGDFFQLPPVSKDSKSKFAFESTSWREANPIICYLHEQHRQEDTDFLDLLAAMRRNDFSSSHRARLKARSLAPERSVATRLYTHNADVDRINQESLAAIPGACKVFHMQTRGQRKLVDTLMQNCLSPETLELKKGAAVMFTRNNFDMGYVNGTLGEVAGFADSGYPLIKLRSGRTIEPQLGEWSIADGNKILAQIKQLPLRLAWAITVHKSQGMSLDAAVIDLSQAFEYGQGYVAISRVRSLTGLFLEGFNERALELHPKVTAADRYFRAYSEAASKKFSSLPDPKKEKLEKNFLCAIGAKETSIVLKAISAVKQAFSGNVSSKLERLREKYPNVGKKWTAEDDATLKDMFAGKIKNADIAKHFGRKPGAIRSRLGHLGLIEDTWAKRKIHKRV